MYNLQILKIVPSCIGFLGVAAPYLHQNVE